MEIIQKTWNFLPADENLAERISLETGVSAFIAQTLINRGIDTPRNAWEFLYADKDSLGDPFLLKDMERAVKRIILAVEKRQKIAVYADYDVDGVTSCVVLYKTLKKLGADVTYYMPDRQSEGYGLNTGALEKLIEQGVSLVVTVDCGIASCREVEDTLDKLDIIITDHHQPAEQIPPAYAVINPKQIDCPYPDKNLAGVGVAFKLCQALRQSWQKDGQKHEAGAGNGAFLDDIDLVAVGTIADIAPLIGENRLLVKLGLQEMEKTANVGLKELMAASSLGGKKIDSTAVGYILAPRLNAAGRMNSAGAAVELLLTEDIREASRLAGVLNNENSNRQATEKEILAKAEDELRLIDLEKAKVLVLSGQEWHLGVIGIVASRLVEKYNRPVVMISVSGGVGKASCRSIAAFDIYAALEKCAGILTRFGGHRQAAGLTIDEDKIDALRQMLNDIAAGELRRDDYLPVLNIDALVPLNEINSEFMSQLACLAPHGAGNPSPSFAAFDVSIADSRAMGQSSQHLKLKVKKENGSGHNFEVVAWNFGSLAKSFRTRDDIDIVFYPKYNEWQGNLSIQLTASDIRLKPAYSHLPGGQNCFVPPDASFPHSPMRGQAGTGAVKSYNLLDREIIGKIYLLLKKDFWRQDLSFRVTADIITDRLYNATKIIISPQAVDIALTILKELNLLWYKLSADWYHIHMLPVPPEKLNLAQSPTYRLNMSRSLAE